MTAAVAPLALASIQMAQPDRSRPAKGKAIPADAISADHVDYCVPAHGRARAFTRARFRRGDR
jgi:hypothetical protein